QEQTIFPCTSSLAILISQCCISSPVGGKIMSRRHLAVAAVLLALAPAVRASDPVGIYAVVDKVMVSPSSGQAGRTPVWCGYGLTKVPADDSMAKKLLAVKPPAQDKDKTRP